MARRRVETHERYAHHILTEIECAVSISFRSPVSRLSIALDFLAFECRDSER